MLPSVRTELFAARAGLEYTSNADGVRRRPHAVKPGGISVYKSYRDLKNFYQKLRLRVSPEITLKARVVWLLWHVAHGRHSTSFLLML